MRPESTGPGFRLALAAALALFGCARLPAMSAPGAPAGQALRVSGDLDGDGVDEVVQVLASRAEPGDETFERALDGGEGDSLRRASLVLPAPAQLRAARVVAGRIEIDLVEAGLDDPACCPGTLITRRFALIGGLLQEELPARTTGRLAPDTLAGREWVLRAWSDGSRAPADPELTLVFDDGRFAGSSGCNRWFAAVQAGERPGEITLGPIGSTRRGCPPPLAALEARYLAELAGAKRLGFAAGQLALGVEREGAAGGLRFEPRPPRVAATCAGAKTARKAARRHLRSTEIP